MTDIAALCSVRNKCFLSLDYHSSQQYTWRFRTHHACLDQVWSSTWQLHSHMAKRNSNMETVVK